MCGSNDITSYLHVLLKLHSRLQICEELTRMGFFYGEIGNMVMVLFNIYYYHVYLLIYMSRML